jgi:hypothetical protein
MESNETTPEPVVEAAPVAEPVVENNDYADIEAKALEAMKTVAEEETTEEVAAEPETQEVVAAKEAPVAPAQLTPEQYEVAEKTAFNSYLKDTYQLDGAQFPYAPLEIKEGMKLEDLPEGTAAILDEYHYNPISFHKKYVMPLIRAEVMQILQWKESQATSQQAAAQDKSQFLDSNPEAKKAFDALVGKGRSEGDALSIVKDVFAGKRTTEQATPQKPKQQKSVKGSQPATRPVKTELPDRLGIQNDNDDWQAEVLRKVMDAMEQNQ